LGNSTINPELANRGQKRVSHGKQKKSNRHPPIWILQHLSEALSPRARPGWAGNRYTKCRIAPLRDGSPLAGHHLGAGRTPDGRKFRVRAQAFVLAAGGLENGRILLLQNSLQPGGLGNQYDMVGRCFMDHPAIRLGVLTPSSRAVFEQARFYDQHDNGGQAMMYQLHIRPEVIRREKMLNLCAVLVAHFKNFRANGPAILHQLLTRSLRFLFKCLSTAAPHSSLQNGEEPPLPLRQRLLKQYCSLGRCGWSRLGRLERCFAEFGVHSLVEQSPTALYASG
jgi:hypothetical protein